MGTNILAQIKEWLIERKVKRLVVVLTSVETKEVLERWEFKVEYETDENQDSKEGNENANPNSDTPQNNTQMGAKKDKNYCNPSKKDEKAIRKDIGAVIRQIT